MNLGLNRQTMIETIAGDLYDYPKYYDLVFGSDWKTEFDFLLACFDKHEEDLGDACKKAIADTVGE